MKLSMRRPLPWLFTGGLVLSAGAIAFAADKPNAPHQIIKTLAAGISHSAFFGVSFDAGKGVAVGDGGVIYESTDGGSTWKPVAQNQTELALLAVDRRGPHTIAVGQAGIVMVEDARGKWVKVDPGAISRLFSVSVNSAGLAIAVGEFGAVIKSADGGRSWASVAPDWHALADPDSFGTNEPNLYSTYVSEAGEITIAGEFGVMLRSADTGVSWTLLRPIVAKAPTISATYFPADGVGNSYAVGQGGELLVSEDNGLSWGRCSIATKANFLGVAAGVDGHVVITGMRVMMRSRNHGMTWEAVEEGDTVTDWYQAVRVEPGSGRMVAVGHSGKIIQVGG